MLSVPILPDIKQQKNQRKEVYRALKPKTIRVKILVLMLQKTIPRRFEKIKFMDV